MSNYDPLSLLGVIGTWIAVFLATCALLGIVTPILLFKALHSERNSALNAVRDIDEEFVTRGVGFGKNRLFHKIRVPKLAPAVDWSRHAAFTIPKSDESWHLRKIRRTYCRTGWARACMLLNAYGVEWETSNTLLIKNERTWLPVSRYWILTVGLLGRYGHRADKGISSNANIVRRDLDELRVLRDALEDNSIEEDSMDDYSSDEAPHSSVPSVAHTSGSRNHELNIVYGMTGALRRIIPRNSREEDLRSPLSFTLHNEEEIELELESTRSGPNTNNYIIPQTIDTDGLDLRSLYWLASGFLPLSGSDPSSVACLEDAMVDGLWGERAMSGSSLFLNSNESFPRSLDEISDHSFLPKWRTFELVEGNSLPISLHRATMAFGMSSTRIFTFRETTDKILNDEIEKEHIDTHANGDQIGSGMARWLPIDSEVYGKRHSSLLLRRSDVQRLVLELMKLPWHPWSYLIWTKNNHSWVSRMNNAQDLLALVPEYRPMAPDGVEDGPKWQKDFRKICRRVCRWEKFPKFHQRKVSDFITFQDMLWQGLKGHETIALAISILYVTNKTFQQGIRTKCFQGSKADLSQDTIFTVSPEDRTITLLDYIPRESEASSTSSDSGNNSLDDQVQIKNESSKPGSRFESKSVSLSKEPLPDISSKGAIAPAETVEDRSQGDLVETDETRTGASGIQKEGSKPLEQSRVERGEIEHSALMETEDGKSSSRNQEKRAEKYELDKDLGIELDPLDRQVSIQIAIMASLWAATKCALWTSSIESKPLLDFVRGLDEVAHIC